LTFDNCHLPHGATFAGVQCWHPDTFLTLYCHQNPDARTRARRSIACAASRVSPETRRRLLAEAEAVGK
jgi:hypothetical protein